MSGSFVSHLLKTVSVLLVAAFLGDTASAQYVSTVEFNASHLVQGEGETPESIDFQVLDSGGSPTTTIPAGWYEVVYLDGALKYSDQEGFNWTVFDHDAGPGIVNWEVVYQGGGGAAALTLPGDKVGYDTIQACVAANQGGSIRFYHSGGTIAVKFLDDNGQSWYTAEDNEVGNYFVWGLRPAVNDITSTGDCLDLVIGEVDASEPDLRDGNNAAGDKGSHELPLDTYVRIQALVPAGFTNSNSGVTFNFEALPEGVAVYDADKVKLTAPATWTLSDGSQLFYIRAEVAFSMNGEHLVLEDDDGQAVRDSGGAAVYICHDQESVKAGGCGSCGGSCIGTSGGSTGCLEFRIELGRIGFGEDGGYLLMLSHRPNDLLSTPAGLQRFLSDRLLVGRFSSDGDMIRPNPAHGSQDAAWGEAELDVVSDYEYSIIFRIDTTDNGINDTVYRTVTVENPDGASDNTKLHISETMTIPGNGTSTRVWHYEWDDTSDEWELKHGEDDAGVTYMSVERRTESVAGALRTETVTIEETDSTVVSKVIEVYEAFAWGEELVERTVDPDGLKLKSVWTYYDDAGTDGDNYGFMESYTSPTGMWERYEYHADGYVERTVRQLHDELLTMADSMTVAAGKNVAVEYSEHTLTLTGGEGVEVDRTVMLIKGSPEMASYVIRRENSSVAGCDEEWRVQSATADPEGAGTLQAFIEGLFANTTHTDYTPGNSSGHLITRTWRYTDEQTGVGGEDDSETYDVKQVQRPDGSMMFYTRTIDDDERTTVTSSGIPNGVGTAITYGMRSTGVVDARGNMLTSLSERITPDANGGAWFVTGLVKVAESDEFGRPTKTDTYYGEEAEDENTTSGTGTRSYRTEASYGCCGGSRVESTTDRLGIVTSHTYDILGRRVRTLRGNTTSGELRTVSVYDAAGRTTDSGIDENGSDTLTRGGTDVVTTATYNVAGRRIASEDPEGRMSYQVQRRVKADGSTFVVGTDTGVFYWETRSYGHDNSAPISVSWTDSHGTAVLQAVCSTAGTWSKVSPPDGTESLTIHRQTASVDQWVDVGGGDYEHQRLSYAYHNLSTIGGDWMGDLGDDDDYMVVSKVQMDALGRAYRQTDALGNISEPIFESGTGRTLGTRVGIDTGAMHVVSRVFYREFEGGDDADDPSGDWRPYVTRSYSVRPGLAEAPVEDAAMSDYTYTETTESFTISGGALETHTMWSKPSASGAPWSSRVSDDQGRVVAQYTYQHGSTSYLLSGTTTTYYPHMGDSGESYEQGQVAYVDRFANNGSGGLLTDSLRTSFGYDDAGRQVMTSTPGSGFSKVEFDQYGRTLRQVFASSEGTNTDVFGDDAFTDDIILSESVNHYNLAGEVLYTVSYARAHDASGATTGLLSAAGVNQSRVSYTAVWRDDNRRPTHQAFYGTNGGSALTDFDPGTGGVQPYSDGPPEPDESDDVLVSVTEYDDAGVPYLTTANDGRQTRIYTDDAGNRTFVVEGYDATKLTGGNPATPASRDADVNRVTQYEYNYASTSSGGGVMIAMTAIDPNADGTLTDNQTTYYLHSGEVNSAKRGFVPVNGRPVAVLYPDAEEDGTDRADVVTAINAGTPGDFIYIEYYAGGGGYRSTDPRGVVWTTAYTAAGQIDHRRVTEPGASWNPTGDLRVAYSYGDAGEVMTITTYSDAAGTTETSQVSYTYDGFYNRLTEVQDHDPAANSGAGIPQTVGYAYDTTAAGNIYTRAYRMDTLTYPNGREVGLVYDGHNGIDDAIGRVNGIDEVIPGSGGTPVTRYTYLGGGTMVRKDYPGPDVRLDFIDEGTEGASGTDDYDASLSRLGRVERFQWERYDSNGDGADVAGSDGEAIYHTTHGHDRVGQKLYDRRHVYTGYSTVYRHDGLHRITGRDVGPIIVDDVTDEVELDGVTGFADVLAFWKLNGRDATLDQLGNALSVDTESDDDRFAAEFNTGNEVTTATSDATQGADEAAVYFTSPDDKLLFTELLNCVAGDLTLSSNNLKVTAGSTSAPAVLITGEPLGPISVQAPVRTPSGHTTGGLVGIVFGYKSPLDYWVYAKNFSNGMWEVYHMHDADSSGTIDYTDVGPSDSNEKQFIDDYSAGGTNALTWYSLQFRPLAFTANVMAGGAGVLPWGGFPSGKYGLYCEVDGAEYDYARWFLPESATPLSAAWENEGAITLQNNSGDGRIQLINTFHKEYLPVLRCGLRAQRFEATFSMTREYNYGGHFRFVFNYQGPGHYDCIRLNHWPTSSPPYAYEVRDGESFAALSVDRSTTHLPGVAGNATKLWYRVVSDGVDVKVFAALSEAGLDSVQSNDEWCMRTTVSTGRFAFSDGTGQIGFLGGSTSYADDITFKTDPDNDADLTDTATYETTEFQETFDLTDSRMVDTFTHDAAGNLTFDGSFRYEYDAMNRLVSIRMAGEDAATPGSQLASYRYDGMGRIIEETTYTAEGADVVVRNYHDGWNIIETRDAYTGGGRMTSQNIWDSLAGHYIDSLAQVAHNLNPGVDDDASAGATQDLVDARLFVLQDPLFNVVAIVTAKGSLVERYEYDQNGRRTTYRPAGFDYARYAMADVSNDGDVDVFEGGGQGDLQIVLGGYGSATSWDRAGGEITGDGTVDVDDTDFVQAQMLAFNALNDRLAYAPTTRPTALSYGSESGLPLMRHGMQGHVQDDRLGLVHMRNRVYTTTPGGEGGRFLQRDPLGYPDGMNAYAGYFGMLSKLDPSGRATAAIRRATGSSISSLELLMSTALHELLNPHIADPPSRIDNPAAWEQWASQFITEGYFNETNISNHEGDTGVGITRAWINVTFDCSCNENFGFYQVTNIEVDYLTVISLDVRRINNPRNPVHERNDKDERELGLRDIHGHEVRHQIAHEHYFKKEMPGILQEMESESGTLFWLESTGLPLSYMECIELGDGKSEWGSFLSKVYQRIGEPGGAHSPIVGSVQPEDKVGYPLPAGFPNVSPFDFIGAGTEESPLLPASDPSQNLRDRGYVPVTDGDA